MHLAVVAARLGQQPDDEGDAGRVDVVDVGEVEDHAPRVAARRLA